MSIYSAVETSLRSCIEDILDVIGITDVPVIYSHQNGLEPTSTYCILNVLGHTQIGRMNESTYLMKDEDVLESITQYSVQTQISFVGANADGVASDFKHALSNNRSCIDVTQRNNFGILNKSQLRRIPQKRETQWVAMSNMDIDFSFAVRTRQSYDWVEFITLNGEVIRIWNDE